MTKDDTLEGSYQQANKDLINRRNEPGPKHLKFFLFVFSKDECTALVVGSDDVASSYGIGVLMGRLAGRREGSRGARVVASY